jgi:hypothetical protein
MSYDPHRYPGHRTLMPHEAPAGASGPPWAVQTYQEQPGYGDAFDGAQAYAGAQDHAGNDGYPAQDGYADRYAGYGGMQDGGYGEAQGAGHGGYAAAPAGYAAAPAGYAGTPSGYSNRARYAQAPYGQPEYSHPEYGHPEYGQSDFGQPEYSESDFGQAGYGQVEYGAPAGYQDARSSGPMLAAPDETRWDGFGRDDLDQVSTDDGPGMIAGGVTGLVAAGAAIGIATLAAAFFRPQASPIIAVGEWFIDHTPSWLKNFAVEKFGEHDKQMLLLGMYVTIAFLAIGIGVLARRRTVIGIVGVAAFGLFGAYIAYTRPASKFSDVIPSIIGGIAGVAALLWLAHAATDESGRPGRAGRHGGPRTAGGWS